MYKRILRVGHNWEATNPHETMVEREYIIEEARALFRNSCTLISRGGGLNLRG
jgi:hypothetical protein